MATSTLGGLEVVFSGDTRPLARSTREAEGIIARAEKSIGVAVGRIGVAFAAAFAGRAIAGAINNTVQSFVQLNREAQALGLTAQQMAQLRFAAESTGTSFDQLTQAFGKLATGMRPGEVNETTIALRNLGVAIRDSGQLRSVTAVFEDVAAALQRLPDVPARARWRFSYSGNQGFVSYHCSTRAPRASGASAKSFAG